MTTPSFPECHLVEPLTPAEEKVLELLAQGLSDKEIGIKLSIAPITVRGDHKQNLYDKLGLPPGFRNRKWAVYCAQQLGLVAGGNKDEDLDPPGDNPYKGLDAFQQEDAEVFFGREAFVERLLTRLDRNGSTPRFLALVGPSGSGKSSVIRAGLIPALKQGHLPGGNTWALTTMSPRTNPFFELEAALRAVAMKHQPDLLELLQRDSNGLARAARLILPEERPLLLMIDQFEENFTLVEDSALARRFMDLIYAAVTDPRSTVRVVITLRADFLDRPLMYPDFSWLVQEHTLMMVPLTPDELERAITLPAQHAHVMMEPGLVARLVTEAHEQPGALPLLQFALTELYDNRVGRTLTMKTYEEIGGLQRALTAQADKVFAGLSDVQQATARQLFLRLITLGEGTEDVRRRVPTQELTSLDVPAETMDYVTHFLAANRLLTLDLDPTTGQPLVEVSHEALIREWVQLRAWLDESRNDVRMERLLALAVHDWEDHGCPNDYLLQGTKLAQFEGWRETTNLSLTTAEHAFLNASVAERDRLAAAERERQMHEQQLERRSRAFLRGLVAVLLLAMLGAFGLSAAAFNQRRIAQEERARAEQQTRIAQARELVGYASDSLDSDAELSALLALQAVNQTYATDGMVLPEAETALHQAVQQLNPPLRLPSAAWEWEIHGNLTISEDGARVAYNIETAYSGRSGETAIADIQTGKVLYTVTGELMGGIDTSDRIVTWDGTPDAPTLFHWDISSAQAPRQLHSFAMPAEFETLDNWIDISLDFRYATLTWQTGISKQFDLTTGEDVTDLVNLPRGMGSTTFSPDGVLMAHITPDRALSIIETATWDEHRHLSVSGTTIDYFKFGPGGTRIITINRNNSVTVWDVTSGAELAAVSPPFTPARVALSRDGSRLAIVSINGQLVIYDTIAQEAVLSFGIGPKVGDIAFDGTATRLVSMHTTGQVQIWNLVAGAEFRAIVNEPILDNGPSGLAYSPDGERLIVASMSATPIVWDVRSGQRILSLVGHASRVLSVAWSPDGTTLATAGEDTNVILWDAVTGARKRTLAGHSDSVYGLAFSPDSSRVASSGFDQTVFIWDATTGDRLLRLEQPASSKGVAWSPDGTRLAAGTDLAGGEGFLRIWDSATGELQLEVSVGESRTGTVTFNPDGTRIAVGLQEANAALVIDAQTGVVLLTLAGHISNVPGVAYSPDGSLIATSGINNDATVRLWNAQTGQEQLVLANVANGIGVARIAFSPDGQYLAAHMNDGTTRIYVLAVPELIALTESRLTRSLTDAECQRYLHVETCPATS